MNSLNRWRKQWVPLTLRTKTKDYNDQVVNTPSPKFRLTRERGGGSILHVVTESQRESGLAERGRGRRDGFFLRVLLKGRQRKTPGGTK